MGTALDALMLFPIADENYPKAWQRLNERFDNSTLIFLETIAALFKLQLVDKSNALQLQGWVDILFDRNLTFASIASTVDTESHSAHQRVDVAAATKLTDHSSTT